MPYPQDSEVTQQGRLLTVAATGFSPRDGNPSLTVADQGEGQTPDNVPHTFMSLQKSNKLRIPFVQGKFNMGGTGALLFSGGEDGIQLIVTRRNPMLLSTAASPRDRQWSFTVVRREDPRGGARSSMFTYLAPVPLPGESKLGVLSFSAKTWPIFPEADKSIRDAYSRHSEYGSLVKLYEYEWRGTSSNIVFSGTGLLRQIDVGLPELALPVRLYECRPAYKGDPQSFSTNALGLVARLKSDKSNNLELVDPIGAGITINGKSIPVRIYVFHPDKAGQYRTARQGIIFSVNGQTHGMQTIDFFRRKSVGLSYLADSLLVMVDCSSIEGRMRENIFMNSRDRLRDTPLARDIETALEQLLRNDPSLRELSNRRRQLALQDKLSDEKPLAQVLRGLIKSNPMLSKFLLSGLQLSAPFPPGNTAGAGSSKTFVGKRFPTYFRLKGLNEAETLQRNSSLGARPRITLETDAEDEYFTRLDDPGALKVTLTNSSGLGVEGNEIDWDWTGPTFGVLYLTLSLPTGLCVGDVLTVLVEVTDPTRPDSFANLVTVTITQQGKQSEPGKPNRPKVSNVGDGTHGGSGGLSLPSVIEVKEADWPTHGFNDESALRVVSSSQPEANGAILHDFFINVDNKYLKILQKESAVDPILIERQFIYGLVLIGLALLQDAERRPSAGSGTENDIDSIIRDTTRAIAPVLVPMLQAIGALSTEDFNE